MTVRGGACMTRFGTANRPCSGISLVYANEALTDVGYKK